ncbi:MAG: GntR family transcriptional regulator [Betaproteobacteria bacterium]|nr:GntR family transcriptional regulator [Betaproteobacteria bacterium]OGA32667.1 MAG: GntR family transcriptional regulator [Betaproteobacteria bacterium RIFCSPLOWO2_12_FULL_64_23]
MNQDLQSVSPSMSAETVAEPRLLVEEVLERLRDLIVQGELAPGVKLNERVLCERLRTSRTPVREAIKFLASEGLVELLPNRGAIVTPITVTTVREMFVLLGALEALAGELACVNASDADIAEIRALHYQMLAHHARGELAPYFRCNQQIHLRLVESTGNATLANTYRALNGHVRRARYMANLSRERWDHAVEEHQKILDALIRRDGALLPALLRGHLGNKMLVVLEALGEQAD